MSFITDRLMKYSETGYINKDTFINLAEIYDNNLCRQLGIHGLSGNGVISTEFGTEFGAMMDKHVFGRHKQTRRAIPSQDVPLFDYDLVRAYVWAIFNVTQLDENTYACNAWHNGSTQFMPIKGDIIKINYYMLEKIVFGVWRRLLNNNLDLINAPGYVINLIPRHPFQFRQPNLLYNVSRFTRPGTSKLPYYTIFNQVRFSFITLFRSPDITLKDLSELDITTYNDFVKSHVSYNLVQFWDKYTGDKYNGESYKIMFPGTVLLDNPNITKFCVISMVDEYIMGLLLDDDVKFDYLFRAPGYPIENCSKELIEDKPRVYKLTSKEIQLVRIDRVIEVNTPTHPVTGKLFEVPWDTSKSKYKNPHYAHTLLAFEDFEMKKKLLHFIRHYSEYSLNDRIDFLDALKDYVIIKPL